MDILNRIPPAIKRDNCRQGHLFDYASEMTGRDKNGLIHCRCARCGVLFSEDCGLSLIRHGDIAPLYQYGVMYA